MLHTGDRLVETFRDLVRAAVAAQRIETTEECEVYVVALLAGHVRARLDEAPLALRYLAAEAGPDPRGDLRRLGDAALFVAGLFPDSLGRSLVGIDYCAAMGRTAYARVSDLERRREVAALFGELAAKFLPLVDVLNEVAERGNLAGDANILLLYERWLRTGSARLGRRLAEAGVLPTPLDPRSIQ